MRAAGALLLEAMLILPSPLPLPSLSCRGVVCFSLLALHLRLKYRCIYFPWIATRLEIVAVERQAPRNSSVVVE